MPADSPQACLSVLTAALVRRDMDAALGLMTDDVLFFYSNGTVITGKDAFAALMTSSWKAVEGYAYAHTEPVWVLEAADAAAAVYGFTWSGVVRGQAVGGGGRATRVFRRNADGWRLAHEHLSPGDAPP